MSPDPPEPPDPPDLGSVMVTMGMDLRVVPAEEWWEERGRDSSLDGERDLGLMVTDFLETGGGGSGGGGGDSWCSSDSDSEFLDPSYLSDQIQVP
ncbi:BnaCnng60700D [Brassica napus]|uniref:BnaCnng60700D protein n=1 Tax=Brassica napus TaxID=3708 RepID=A0A078JQY4_BRANA|nr:BnaCnng60700D [Brassica napus]